MGALESHLQVDEQALHRSVRGMNDQMEVELLDEEKLILQDLLQNLLLPSWCLLKVANKLRAGHIELIHLAGKV